MVPCEPVWSCTVPFGSVWSLIVPYSPQRSSMVPYDPVWSPLDLCGPVWSHLFRYGYVLSRMFMLGPLWSPMGLYGLCHINLPYCSIKSCKVSNFRRYWQLCLLVFWQLRAILGLSMSIRGQFGNPEAIWMFHMTNLQRFLGSMLPQYMALCVSQIVS